ncbi:MAG: acetate--CoA ligase family protein [Bilophila wadsworthia]
MSARAYGVDLARIILPLRGDCQNGKRSAAGRREDVPRILLGRCRRRGPQYNPPRRHRGTSAWSPTAGYRRANIFGVMLTPMLKGGVECIIGSSWTAPSGLRSCSTGILLKPNVSFRVAPVNMPSCRRMVREINGLAMLQGARGSKPCDLEALAEAACLISHMVDELRDIAEVDLNPVFAWEKGLAVADARIVLQAR